MFTVRSPARAEGPVTKRKDVVRLLETEGFVSKGGTNHEVFEHPDGRRTVVPRHREVQEPTFRLIKKQAKLT